ncbi:hypothetical protein KM043_001181 [Ampulex compressa]|nr:hypothetical protein KM043_001181 [Ampulex compressa]
MTAAGVRAGSPADGALIQAPGATIDPPRSPNSSRSAARLSVSGALARAAHVVESGWCARRYLGGTKLAAARPLAVLPRCAQRPRRRPLAQAQGRPTSSEADPGPSTNSAVAITRDEDNNGRHERALPPMPFSEAFSGAFRERSQAAPRSGSDDAPGTPRLAPDWSLPRAAGRPLVESGACPWRGGHLVRVA